MRAAREIANVSHSPSDTTAGAAPRRSASSSITIGNVRPGRLAMGAVSASARDHVRAVDARPAAPRSCRAPRIDRQHGPVMLRPRAPRRNSTAPATSSISGSRFKRAAAHDLRAMGLVHPFVISVSRKPGRDRVDGDARPGRLRAPAIA
jgi:hypothetical protein